MYESNDYRYKWTIRSIHTGIRWPKSFYAVALKWTILQNKHNHGYNIYTVIITRAATNTRSASSFNRCGTKECRTLNCTHRRRSAEVQLPDRWKHERADFSEIHGADSQTYWVSELWTIVNGQPTNVNILEHKNRTEHIKACNIKFFLCSPKFFFLFD